QQLLDRRGPPPNAQRTPQPIPFFCRSPPKNSVHAPNALLFLTTTSPRDGDPHFFPGLPPRKALCFLQLPSVSPRICAERPAPLHTSGNFQCHCGRNPDIPSQHALELPFSAGTHREARVSRIAI